MLCSWTISVAGQIYGPYSLDQMRAFSAQGRLARHSLVARSGEAEFCRAAEDTQLAAIFLSPQPESALAQPLQHDAQDLGHTEQGRNGECAHMLIVADLKSGSIARLEEEITSLGQSVAILPQAWLLSTSCSVNSVRNRLVRQLGKLDLLFVADTSSDKAAWFNFGPEADARIRRLWRPESRFPAAG